MTFVDDLMARLRGWRDPDPVCLGVWWVPDHAEPATRPPAPPYAPIRPTPAPGTHPHRPEPVQATSGTERTDRPLPGVVSPRWHADEAGALARLAELTKDRSPWAAATDMEWSTT